MAEEAIKKTYYSIREVSDKLKVKPSLIRFWEKEFSILSPKKNRKGNRLFTVKDIETLSLIQYLLKKKGYTLSGAKQVLQKDKHHIAEEKKCLDTLKEVRDFLINLKEAL